MRRHRAPPRVPRGLAPSAGPPANATSALESAESPACGARTARAMVSARTAWARGGCRDTSTDDGRRPNGRSVVSGARPLPLRWKLAPLEHCTDVTLADVDASGFGAGDPALTFAPLLCELWLREPRRLPHGAQVTCDRIGRVLDRIDAAGGDGLGHGSNPGPVFAPLIARGCGSSAPGRPRTGL